MAFTHTLTQSVTEEAGSVLQSKAYSHDGTASRDIAIGATDTDRRINVAFDNTLIANIFLICDVALTIKTNDAGAPDDTILLKANVPLIWNADAASSNPFTKPVTALFVTNTVGTNPGTLRVEILEDPISVLPVLVSGEWFDDVSGTTRLNLNFNVPVTVVQFTSADWIFKGGTNVDIYVGLAYVSGSGTKNIAIDMFAVGNYIGQGNPLDYTNNNGDIVAVKGLRPLATFAGFELSGG